MPKKGTQAITIGWIQVHNRRPKANFRLMCLWYSGLQMAKYVSTLIAVSVRRELRQNTMFRNPFNLHRALPSTQPWRKHVYSENGIQSTATPISAHDRLMINMLVRVRSLRRRYTAKQIVPLPTRVASIISSRLPLIRMCSSSLYMATVGSDVVLLSCIFVVSVKLSFPSILWYIWPVGKRDY